MKVVILGSYPTYPFSNELNVPHKGRKVSTWLIYFAKYLSEYQGIELHIVSEDEYLDHDFRFQSDNINFHFLKCPRKYKAATFFLGDVLRIKKELKKINPDIINAHHTDEYALAAVKSKYPYVITVHGIFHLLVPKDKFLSRAKIVSIVEKYVLRHSQNLIASSPFVYEAVGKLTNARFFDVENTLDKKHFNIIKDYSVNYNLTYIGHLIKDKGVHLLLQAVAELKKEFPGVKLRIIGNPSPYETAYYEDLLNFVKSNKLNDSIIFEGFVSEEKKNEILKETTILVHPSRLETFCMAIAEAMASGTPIIASNVGGIPFTIGNQKNGILVPYGSINDLIENIRRLFDDKMLRTEIGQNAQKEATSRFHPSVVIPKLVECYKSILE